jgi:hypothetical protein
MEATMTGKNYLDQFIASVTALISRGLENLFGPGVHATVFGDVTWADLGTVLCLVLFILLVHSLTAAFLRRKTRQAAATEGKEFHHHVFGALGKPLYVLIWIYGIYLAATPLLLKLPADESLRVIRVLFDKLFDLGVFAVVFWLFFRFTLVKNAHDYNGTIPEKYNVITGSHEVFVEYGNVGTKFPYIVTEGFGWMNASFEVGMNFLSPSQLVDLRLLKLPAK